MIEEGGHAERFVSLILLIPFTGELRRAMFTVVVREWRLILGLGASGITMFPPSSFLLCSIPLNKRSAAFLSPVSTHCSAPSPLVNAISRQFGGVLVSMVQEIGARALPGEASPLLTLPKEGDNSALDFGQL